MSSFSLIVVSSLSVGILVWSIESLSRRVTVLSSSDCPSIVIQ